MVILILFSYIENVQISQWEKFPPDTSVNVGITIEDNRLVGEAVMIYKSFFYVSPESSAAYIEKNLIWELSKSKKFKRVVPVGAKIETLLSTRPMYAFNILNNQNIQYLIIITLDRYGIVSGGRLFVSRFEVIKTATGLPVKSGFITAKFTKFKGYYLINDNPDGLLFNALILNAKQGKYYYDLLDNYTPGKATYIGSIKYLAIPLFVNDFYFAIYFPIALYEMSDNLKVGEQYIFGEFPLAEMLGTFVPAMEYIHSDNYKYTGAVFGAYSGCLIGGISGNWVGTLFGTIGGGIVGNIVGEHVKTGHLKDRDVEEIMQEDRREWSF